MHQTPLLVDVRERSFDDYIHSLDKSGRKNFRFVEKRNDDLRYGPVPFDRALVQRFMSLWERQAGGGARFRWAFSIDFVELLHRRGHLACFAAAPRNAPGEPVALHFVEQHGSYVYCHPPMYDKSQHNDRSIAKYMWFRLIEHYLRDPEVRWLDLGAGNRGTWRDLLRTREKGSSYKWLYVPGEVKRDPDGQQPFVARMRLFPYGRWLDPSGRIDSPLVRRARNKWITWVWLHRKRRLRMLGQVLSRPVQRVFCAPGTQP